MRLELRSVWIFAALALLQLQLTGAERQRVPGTGVSFVPPQGFSSSKRFPGFIREDLGASIMITEMPGAVEQTKKALAPEVLRDVGAELISSKTQTVDGRESLLVKLKQPAEGTVSLKWILVTGGEKETLLIVAEFPEDSDARIGEAIRDSILNASWKPETKSKDLFEGLPFRVSATSKLKLAGRMSSNVLLTASGTFGPHGPEEPVLIVGSSIADVDLEDLRAFSERRLKEVTTIRDVRDIQDRAVRVGDMEACELVADATHRDTGTPVRVYQLIAVSKSNPKAYYISGGRSTKDKASEFLREFRRVSGSLRELDPGESSKPSRKEPERKPERPRSKK